jgi:hypothetical protein
MGIRFQIAAGLAAASLSACFVGYDSSWGQAKAAQQRLAARSTPGSIGAATADQGHERSKRTLRIRLRPDTHYLAQTVDAERQLRELVEDANGVLAPGLGLELEVDAIRGWSFEDDDRLDGALRALAKDDASEDVDIVVGLIGALPRPTESLHELGLAEVLGKHVVVRAASRLGEHDAVDRAMPDLDEDARNRVVRARRRHRAEAVFLHEIGHALGALHETETTSVMHPAYDERMNAFGDNAVVLMHLAIDEPDRASALRAQLDYLRAATPASIAAWVPGEREVEIAHLEAMTSGTSEVATSSGPSADSAAAEAPAELALEDRDRFTRATAAFRGGHVAVAYETARPLFAAYPANYAVQDLRCQLATVQWLDKKAMLEECTPVGRLADAGTPAAPPDPAREHRR